MRELALVDDDALLRGILGSYYRGKQLSNLTVVEFGSIKEYMTSGNRPVAHAVVDLGLGEDRVDEVDYTVIMLVQLMINEGTKVVGLTGQPGYERFSDTLAIPVFNSNMTENYEERILESLGII